MNAILCRRVIEGAWRWSSGHQSFHTSVLAKTSLWPRRHIQGWQRAGVDEPEAKARGVEHEAKPTPGAVRHCSLLRWRKRCYGRSFSSATTPGSAVGIIRGSRFVFSFSLCDWTLCDCFLFFFNNCYFFFMRMLLYDNLTLMHHAWYELMDILVKIFSSQMSFLIDLNAKNIILFNCIAYKCKGKKKERPHTS